MASVPGGKRSQRRAYICKEELQRLGAGLFAHITYRALSTDINLGHSYQLDLGLLHELVHGEASHIAQNHALVSLCALHRPATMLIIAPLLPIIHRFTQLTQSLGAVLNRLGLSPTRLSPVSCPAFSAPSRWSARARHQRPPIWLISSQYPEAPWPWPPPSRSS